MSLGGYSVLEHVEVEFQLCSSISTGLRGALAQLSPTRQGRHTNSRSTHRPRAHTSSWRVMRWWTSDLGMYLPKKEAIKTFLKANKGNNSNNACVRNIMNWICVCKPTHLVGQGRQWSWKEVSRKEGRIREHWEFKKLFDRKKPPKAVDSKFALSLLL